MGEYMFFKNIDKRIKIVLFVIVFMFLLIISKVMYIQLFDYEKLKSLANDLWSRNLPIAANRGIITDRNGVVLADNITTTSLVLIPNQIKNPDEVSSKLSEILGQRNVERLNTLGVIMAKSGQFEVTETGKKMIELFNRK